MKKLTFPLLAAAGVLAIAGASAYRLNDRSAVAQSVTQVASQKAPELVGGPWLNTPDGKPISLANRKGKVTVVEFWTFGCSNCRANLPTYAKWHDQFKNKGVEVIGVHTPEFDSEKKVENVKAQVKKLGIDYPVLLDNQSQNWRNWNQRYWPTVYLIGKDGKIRAKWEGELDYNGSSGTARLTKQIEALLAEPAPKGAASANAKLKQTNMKTSETKEKWEVAKTDAQWRAELTPRAIQRFASGRNRGSLYRQTALEEQRDRHLSVRRLRSRFVQVGHQVRFGDGLAELLRRFAGRHHRTHRH